MAVLLVAVFPILLLISSPIAWSGMAVGVLLLYHDNREQGLRPRRLVGAQVRRLKPRAAALAKRGTDNLSNHQAA